MPTAGARRPTGGKGGMRHRKQLDPPWSDTCSRFDVTLLMTTLNELTDFEVSIKNDNEATVPKRAFDFRYVFYVTASIDKIWDELIEREMTRLSWSAPMNRTGGSARRRGT